MEDPDLSQHKFDELYRRSTAPCINDRNSVQPLIHYNGSNVRSRRSQPCFFTPQPEVLTRGRLNVFNNSLQPEQDQVFSRPSSCISKRSHDVMLPSERLSRQQFFSPQPRFGQSRMGFRNRNTLYERGDLCYDGSRPLASSESNAGRGFSRHPFSTSRENEQIIGRVQLVEAPVDTAEVDLISNNHFGVQDLERNRLDGSISEMDGYRNHRRLQDFRRPIGVDFYPEDEEHDYIQSGDHRATRDNLSCRNHSNNNIRHFDIPPDYNVNDECMVEDYQPDHSCAGSLQPGQTSYVHQSDVLHEASDGYPDYGHVNRHDYDQGIGYTGVPSHPRFNTINNNNRSNLTVNNVELHQHAQHDLIQGPHDLLNTSHISSSSCDNPTQPDNLLSHYEPRRTRKSANYKNQVQKTDRRDKQGEINEKHHQQMDIESDKLDRTSDVLPYVAEPIPNRRKGKEPHCQIPELNQPDGAIDTNLERMVNDDDDEEETNDTEIQENPDGTYDQVEDDIEEIDDKVNDIAKKSVKRKRKKDDDSITASDDIKNMDQENKYVNTLSNKKTLMKEKNSKTCSNELHFWIIKTVPQNNGLCVEGKRNISDENFWHSSKVTKRVDQYTVETSSGNQYKLVGDMEMEDALLGGFDASTIQAFANGFPRKWNVFVSKFYKKKERNGGQHEKKEEVTTPVVINKKKSKQKLVSQDKFKTPTGQERKHEENCIFTPEGRHIELDTLKKTRSGRVSKPMVAWWAGQAIKHDATKNTLIVSHQTKYAEEVLQDLSKIYKNNAVKKRASVSSVSKKVDRKSIKGRTLSLDDSANNTPTSQIQVDSSVSLNVEKEVCTILDNMKQSRQQEREQKKKNSLCYEKLKSDVTVKGGKSCDIYSVDEGVESDKQDENRIKNRKSRTRSSSRRKLRKRSVEENNFVNKNDRRRANRQSLRSFSKKERENPETVRKSEIDCSNEQKKTKKHSNRSVCSQEDDDDNVDHTKLKMNHKHTKDSSNTRNLSEDNMQNCDSFVENQKRSLRSRSRVPISKSVLSENDVNVERRRTRSSSKGDKNQVKKYLISDSSDSSDEDYFSKNQGTVKRNNVRSRISRSRGKSESVSNKSVNSLNGKENSSHDEEEEEVYNSKTKNKEMRSQTESHNSEEEEEEISSIGKNKARSKSRRKTVKSRSKAKSNSVDNNVLDSENTEDVRWSKEEINRLNMVMRKIRGDDPNYWDMVSKHVKTKTIEECQNFYFKENPKNTKKKTNDTSSKGKEKVLLTAGVGTLKRKQQLRDLIDNANTDYQEDLFDGTPYRSQQCSKVPRINEEETDVFAELADRNPHIAGKIFTPMTRLNIQPVSTHKTPTSQLVSPWPAIDRKDADKYLRQMHIRRRRLVGKKVKTPASKPMNKNLLPSPVKILFNKRTDDLQSLFMEEGNSSDDHKDSEEENDYYFSSGDEN